jgi:rubrerythrin
MPTGAARATMTPSTHVQRRRRNSMDAQTHTNVMAALQSEAIDYARNTMRATEAREEGDAKAAALLEDMSRTGLTKHFAELAKLAKIVGGDADNLVGAIQELGGREATYRKFAEQAHAVGDHEAAELFERIRADEAEDVRALEREVERLEVPA